MTHKIFRLVSSLLLAFVVIAIDSSPQPALASKPSHISLQGAGGQSTLFLVQEGPGGPPVNDVLLKFESGTLSTVGNIGFGDIRGLAYDAATDTLYGVSRTSLRLITIDRTTGVGTPVSDNLYLPLDSNTAEISVDSAGTMFGLGHSDSQCCIDTLLNVDKGTGIASPLGVFDVSFLSGLAIDHISGTIYGTDFDGQLYTIDPSGSPATFVGQITASNGGVARIAFDHVSGTLYGITFNQQLVTVDLSTLVATEVAQFSIPTQIYSLDFAETTTEIIQASIDIKPGSQSNPINPQSIGKIPVAILSTADFDAPSEVDKTSLTFGKTGDELSLVSCNRKGEDVNGDGLLDLVCHFKTKLTGFRIGDTEGLLKGQTLDGVSIEGRDLVRILK